MGYREEDFFKIFEDIEKPVKETEYFTWCLWMNETKGLKGDKDFKKLLKSKKELILQDEPDFTIAGLKDWRKENKEPKSHFWWWIDKL